MKDDKVLATALGRFEKAESHEKEDRDLAAEDFRFAAGEQWPDSIKRQREASNRPCLTFNRLPQFIRQVTGEARQNKPAVKVIPVDSGADVDLAEVYNGLIRNIESQSHAEEAYITALENGVTGGVGGGWRVCTEYSSNDTFDQDIRIKRIANPFAIWWDTNAKEFDKSDANWCFVSEWITKEQYEVKYPNHTPSDWEQDFRGSSRGWLADNRVRLAEYWVKTPVKKTLGLINGKVIEVTKELKNYPYEKTREVDSFKIERYLLSGHAVLEGPDVFPGEYIPIIPCYGPEEWIDDRVRHVSLIRYAKDPQRMYNFWQSTIAEKIALAPKAPWLVTPQMIAGLEGFWNTANVENRPYLPYNPDPQGGRPQRELPAAVNTAEIQQAGQAIEDLKATMGIYDASLGAGGNETSGRAIIARQREGDNATFAWIDNLARSIQHTGRILVGLIPKIYDTQRVIRVLGEDGTQEMVEINTVVAGQLVNDLTVGKYDVEIVVGPNYRTKRLESAESMLAFVSALPQAGAFIADLIAKNLDWPGADVIAERLKKALPPGIDEESEPPPPDPVNQLAVQKMEAEVEGAQLDNTQKQVELAAMTGQVQELVAAEVQRVLMGMMQPAEVPEGVPLGM